MLTQIKLKELLSYDPATGVFTLVKHRHGTTRTAQQAEQQTQPPPEGT